MVSIKHNKFKVMPKNCNVCPMCIRDNNNDFVCCVTEIILQMNHEFNRMKERHKECPLVEVSVALKEKGKGYETKRTTL